MILIKHYRNHSYFRDITDKRDANLDLDLVHIGKYTVERDMKSRLETTQMLLIHLYLTKYQVVARRVGR